MMKRKTIFFASALLFFASYHQPLGAQEAVAVHPFWGPEQTTGLETTAGILEMMDMFYTAVTDYIPRADSNYSVFHISLDNLPSDVPDGGFPPWITPSPSITGDSPFAITGEVAADRQFIGMYRLRVYLWRMEGAVLLGSDEITAGGQEDMEGILFFMQWVLSWIVEETEVAPIIIVQTAPSTETESNSPESPIYTGNTTLRYIQEGDTAVSEHRLHLGIRLGGGSSSYIYNYVPDDIITRHSTTMFNNALAALQASFSVYGFFGLQLEAIVSTDFGPIVSLSPDQDTETVYLGQLYVPILAKLDFESNQIRAGIFLGVYYQMPLFQIASESSAKAFEYQADIPGLVFGLSVGKKVGPGYMFLDGRLEYDWRSLSSDNEMAIYYRNFAKISIGYEIGFLPKRKPAVAMPETD